MRLVSFRRVALALPIALLASVTQAQPVPPSFASVVGHDFGERITVHHQMAAYLNALAERSPRVTVVDQGPSWEGRSLLYAIVTSPAHHARLNSIREGARALADPRDLDDASRARLLAEQPAVVWMGGSIHGFELSGSEGLLKLLEHLATREDEATLQVLDETVVLIDPMINPDGRDAFAAFNHARLGRAPIASRQDWNNDISRWDALRFRTGHYFFDTNRDWFAHTQAETRARWATLRDWRPQVVIDAHEMGSDVEFYFDPPADPYGPSFPPFARTWFDRFSQAYAEAFDRRGFEYMTGERFNYFYPGYTTSWGSYQGAVGMLYEQGSSRGLAITRSDDTVRTLADALEQQYTAAWTAALTSARQRRDLLEAYHDAHRQIVDDGRRGVRRYLVPPHAAQDPGAWHELVTLLERNGIEIGSLREPVRLDGLRDREGRPVAARTFDAGTVVVERAQPRGRLVDVLLAPDQPLDEAFLVEARSRLDRGQNPRFYDITAWSLPLLFDLQAFGSTGAEALDVVPFASPGVAAPALENAGYAYLLDGRDARALSVLHRLKEAGYRAAVTLAPTTVEGLPVSRGSVVVRVGQNDDSVHEAVREMASHFGVAVRGVDTGLGAVGQPALGSGDVVPARRARIALLTEGPIDAYSFGWAWYVLDRQYELPVTVLRARRLADQDLAAFDTVVVPDVGNAPALGRHLGEAGVSRLVQWIRDGGTLVALGEAVEVAREHLGLDGLRSVYDDLADGEGEPTRFRVPGALLRAELDPAVWLTAGLSGSTLPWLANSDRLYRPAPGPPDPGQRAAVRFAENDLLVAGHVWSESMERLPGTLAVFEQRIGGGRIVAFTDDPNFRAYWRGADRLFLNAVVLGPSAP